MEGLGTASTEGEIDGGGGGARGPSGGDGGRGLEGREEIEGRAGAVRHSLCLRPCVREKLRGEMRKIDMALCVLLLPLIATVAACVRV